MKNLQNKSEYALVFRFIFFMTFLLFSISSVNADEISRKVPKAEKGVLDLRNWSFEKDGTVSLFGEWEYYWMQNLSPHDFLDRNTNLSGYYVYPSEITNYSINGKKLTEQGFCTYRIKILLNSKQRVPLSINFDNLNVAYIAYINGYEVFRNGIHNKDYRKTLGIISRSNVVHLGDAPDTNEVIIFSSSNKARTLGLYRGSITLGLSSEIRKEREYKIINMFFITGFCFFMAFYHSILFILRPKEKANIIFSFISVGMVLMNFSAGGNFGLFSPLEKYIANEYMPMIILYTLFELIIMFMYFLYPIEFKKKVLYVTFIYYIFSAFYFILDLIGIISDFGGVPIFGFIIFLIYSIFVLFRAFKNKREGATVFLVGFSIILLIVIEFFLNITKLLPSGFMGTYVTFFTLLLQSIVLSIRYSNSFKKVEAQAIELEKHQHHLEELVEERTVQLNERNEELELLNNDLAVKSYQISKEKEKSDRLLLNVLPEQIANRLKSGETTIADHFEEASVIFIDIADFTKMSAKSTPQKMVNMLNDIFSIFDKISAKYGLEKIKTIGDCYMAAAGIPIPRKDHAQAIAMMALEVMETMKGYSYSSDDFNSSVESNIINFRIGLDCGPIVAGVIGEQKFIYDLWGDMVNTASRMETNGVVGKIQCTERFKTKVEEIPLNPPFSKGESVAGGFIPFSKVESTAGGFKPLSNVESRELPSLEKGGQGGFIFIERGEIEIKGKGMMKTYFLEKIND